MQAFPPAGSEALFSKLRMALKVSQTVLARSSGSCKTYCFATTIPGWNVTVSDGGWDWSKNVAKNPIWVLLEKDSTVT